MKKKTFLRTLSFILTLVLVIAVSAIGAFAAEEGTGAGNAAKVGDVEYATVQEAIAAANENDTVYLLRDIDAAEIITVDKAITLNGNGKTITSTAARAINVDCNGTVTIENLTVVASGERAINVIQKPATLVINNVNATAANYAINVAGSAAGAMITVNDSTLTGNATVNIGAENVNVEINDTVIECVDGNENEKYGAITINSNGANSHVVVNGGEMVVAGDSTAASIFSATASVTFNGTENSDNVEKIVACVGMAGYDTLEDAISDAAESGLPVVLMRDVVLDEILVINVPITLNGNGKTITSTAARAINVDCNGTVTIENLTVVASGERAINVIQKPATLVINNVNATAANYAINVAGSAAGATVTVNDSTLTGMSTVNIGAENVNVEINDTVIECVDGNENEKYGAITINSNGANSHVVVNGGEMVVAGDSTAASVFPATASVTFNGTENSDKVEYIVACVGMAGYNTLEDAISAAAKSGSPVDLIRDITLTEKVVISSEVTINGNGHKITSTAKKAFEIVNSTENPIYVTFNDVDIENTAAGGRCIDTRNDYIAVVITNSTITAKNSVGNNKAQPITIGGYENDGTMLMLDNTTVEADGSGYAIICFVLSGIEITNDSYVSGYAAVYMQAGSANSYVSVNNSTVESVSKYAYNQGQFGTIVFTDDGCMIELVGATVKATANGTSTQAALLLNGTLTYVSVDADTSIVTNGTAARAFAEFAQGQVIDVDNVEISGVLAEELASEGFFIEDGGMISELVSIRDVRVMLGQDISMIYTVRVHESVKATNGIAMIFERNGYETLVTDFIDMGDGYYAFVFSKIAPQTMSDIINASLVLTDGEGNVVDTVAELNGYSVKANLAHLLSMNADELGMTPEEYEAMAQLIADTLEYGKAAQDYTGHNKDNPANDGVAGKPAASEWETLGETDKTVTDSVSEELYFTAAGVRFDYVNRMYFKFYAKDIAGVTVTIDGVTYTEADFVSLGAGEYAVYGTELYATDFDYVATVVLGVAGEDVQTLTYSVKSYVYAKQNSDNAVMAALARALYNYGKSAEKYMESMI